MRPIEERFNTSRPITNWTIRPKFILVFEGFCTEVQYFEALRNNRGIAGINSLVDIVLLQREPVDSGLSHPKVVLGLLDEYMRCVRRRGYSIDLILETAVNSVAMCFGLSRTDDRVAEFRSNVQEMSSGYTGKDGFVDDVSDVLDICKEVSARMFGSSPRFDLPDLIEFSPKIDRVCVIVDRDRDNRTPEDMDDFIRHCHRMRYLPYISNPCFEIWFMMHFEAYFDVDAKALLENPMVDGRRFTERELDRMVRDVNPSNSYDKTDFDAGMFLHRTGEAIHCSMMHCHDPNRLKREVGTNLGELLAAMRDVR